MTGSLVFRRDRFSSGASYIFTMVSVCLLGVQKKPICRNSKNPKREHVSANSEQLFFFTPLGKKYCRISKIPKREHVSANSEQLCFLDPPPLPHQKKKIVGFQKFQNESMFQRILSNFFFFGGPPQPGHPPKMTHLQNTLKHLSAKSEGNRCIFQGVLSVLNINFQYISIYFEILKRP